MKWLFSVLLVPLSLSMGAESESGDYPGLEELRLVTDVSSVQPGEPFTVGLWIRHEEKFHTYWRNPGIVGIATMFDWELPEGWTASEITWPNPQTTIMATLTAWGYEGDGTCLLVTLMPPKEIGVPEITLKTRTGWMACARTCHPGWHDFELTLPVSREKTATDEKWAVIFQEVRDSQAGPPPESWKLNLADTGEPREGGKSARLSLAVPDEASEGALAEKVYFFSYDNQVDSDSPQVVRATGKSALELEFVYPDFGPSPKPETLSGLLYRPGGWPGLDTEWVEISVPWGKDVVSTSESE